MWCNTKSMKKKCFLSWLVFNLMLRELTTTTKIATFSKFPKMFKIFKKITKSSKNLSEHFEHFLKTSKEFLSVAKILNGNSAENHFGR